MQKYILLKTIAFASDIYAFGLGGKMRKRMHNLLIYNPVSGRANLRWERIGKILYELTKNGDEVTVYQTQGKGDARLFLGRKSLEQYDLIICCGGDGTLHEVVNGLVNNDIKIPLGYIPAGSTNDYAKNLGINNRNAVECIKERKVYNIDIGSFNGEIFNYVAAFGAFTNISFLTPQKIKNTLGYLAYLLEGVKHLSDIRPYQVKCKVDDTLIEDKIVVGMITNAFSVAGMKNRSNENTRLNDGKLEYILIKMPNNVLELQTIINLLLNSKVDQRFMYYGQFKTMVMHSDKMEWTLDGESGGCFENVEINTYCQALKIIVGSIPENDME